MVTIPDIDRVHSSAKDKRGFKDYEPGETIDLNINLMKTYESEHKGH